MSHRASMLETAGLQVARIARASVSFDDLRQSVRSGAREKNDFDPSKALADLLSFESDFRESANLLKEEYRRNKQRSKEAKRIISRPIGEELSDDYITKIFQDIERAKRILENNSIDFLENAIAEENIEIQRLEAANLKKRTQLETLKMKQKQKEREHNKNTNDFVDSIDELFKMTDANAMQRDTDKRIKQLCRSVQKRNEKIRKDKENLKRMIKENEEERIRIEDLYNEKKDRIAELDNMLEKQSSTKQMQNRAKNEIDEMKQKLTELVEIRSTYERQAYTVTRDRLYNSRFKQQIDALRNGLQAKKDMIQSNKDSIEQMKLHIPQLEAEIKERQDMIASDEARVLQLEKIVNSSGNQFQTTIEQSKKEIDALTEISETIFKQSEKEAGINDEIAALFNEEQTHDEDSPDHYHAPANSFIPTTPKNRRKSANYPIIYSQDLPPTTMYLPTTRAYISPTLKSNASPPVTNRSPILVNPSTNYIYHSPIPRRYIIPQEFSMNMPITMNSVPSSPKNRRRSTSSLAEYTNNIAEVFQ